MARHKEDEPGASPQRDHHSRSRNNQELPSEKYKGSEEQHEKKEALNRREESGTHRTADRDETNGKHQEKERHHHRSKNEDHDTKHRHAESGKEGRKHHEQERAATQEEAKAASLRSSDKYEDKKEDRSKKGGHRRNEADDRERPERRRDKEQMEREQTEREQTERERTERGPREPKEGNAIKHQKHRGSKSPMCEVCEHREAVLWCGGCGDILYCKKCAEADHSRGKRKEHLPLQAAEKAPQRTTTKVVRCEEHGEVLKAYCETDRKAVCSLCLHIGNHKGHSAIELDKAVRSARDAIRKEAGELILERQKVDAFLDELEEIAETVKKNGTDLRSHLRAACDACRAVLAEREAALLVQVDERETEKAAVIARQRVRWKDTVAEVNKARELAEAALKETDPVVLLKKRDTFEQQAHALRIAAARRSATPATTACLDLALETDPIVALLRDSLVFASGLTGSRASSVIARLQQAQNQRASLTDNTVVVLPRVCLEVVKVSPNLATGFDGSPPDAWIGRLWELREHVNARTSSDVALEASRAKRKGTKEPYGKDNDETATSAARKIQARWRGASLRKANSLEVLKAFKGCGLRGSVVYAARPGGSRDGADERYIKALANMGCLVILAVPAAESTAKRAPSLATRSAAATSPLEAWLTSQDFEAIDSKVESGKSAAQIRHLVKALPASIRQSGTFLMGHGAGGALVSRLDSPGILRELVTGIVVSGGDSVDPGMSGNVLVLRFNESVDGSNHFEALVAGDVDSGLVATLPGDYLEEKDLLKDGIVRELLLTFLCKPQRIHLLDKLWETEPHMAKQLTVNGRRGNVLSVTVQPGNGTIRRKPSRAAGTIATPRSTTASKQDAPPVANGPQKLTRSASNRSQLGEVPGDSAPGTEMERKTGYAVEQNEPGLKEGAVDNWPSSGTGPVQTTGPSLMQERNLNQNPDPSPNPNSYLNATANPTPNPISNQNQNATPAPIVKPPTPSAAPATGSLPPGTSPAATALSPRASIQSGGAYTSNQPGTSEPGQPSSLLSRPSFSSSRPPSYTSALPNPSNPASAASATLPGAASNLSAALNPANPPSAYTAASSLTGALGSSYSRPGADAAAPAAARAPSQQSTAAGAYAGGGRSGQPGSGQGAPAGLSDLGAPSRSGLTR